MNKHTGQLLEEEVVLFNNLTWSIAIESRMLRLVVLIEIMDFDSQGMLDI